MNLHCLLPLYNITDKIKFIGNWFSTSGFLDKQECIDILKFLDNIGIIRITDMNNSEKQFSLNIELTHNYDNLNIPVEQITEKMLNFYNSKINTQSNQNIKSEQNIKYDQNIDDNIEQNNNQIDIEEIKNENDQLKQEIEKIKQENNQLVKDNTQLLINLSDYRKFNFLLKDIDILTIKRQIELQMSVLFNQVNHELNNIIQVNEQDNKKLLLQLNCQKQIFNLITTTENNLKSYFFH